MELRNKMSSNLGFTAAIATATVAGCGGGGGGGGLSQADLVKKANTICKGHHNTITIAASKVLAGGKLPTPQAFGKLARQTIVPEYTAQVSELRTLKASGDFAGRYKKWLKDSETTAMRMKMNPMIISNSASFTAVNGQSDSLGLSKDCHVGPS